MKKRSWKMSFGLAAGLSVLAVIPAGAIQYTLGVGNTSLAGGYTGPYGTVDVSLVDSTHATVVFTGGSVGGFDFLFGGNGALNVNVNGSFNVGTITGMVSPSWGAVNNLSEFGDFNLSIDNHGGFSDAGSPMSFALTHTGIGSWSSDADVLVANSDGYLSAAHIFVVNDSTGANPLTGYAGNGGGTTRDLPDGGATMLLLGSALSGLGIISRFAKK